MIMTTSMAPRRPRTWRGQAQRGARRQDPGAGTGQPGDEPGGFEHAATTDADKAKVAAARQQLEQPLALFGLAQAAGCKDEAQELESPLFGDAAHADDDDDADEHEHGHQHAD
jgi:hypothetical protein